MLFRTKGEAAPKLLIEEWLKELENPPSVYDPARLLRAASGLSPEQFREFLDNFALTCALGQHAPIGNRIIQAAEIKHAPWLETGIFGRAFKDVPGDGGVVKTIQCGGFQCYAIPKVSGENRPGAAPSTLHIEVPAPQEAISVQAFMKTWNGELKIVRGTYDAAKRCYRLRLADFSGAVDPDSNTVGKTGHAVLVIVRHAPGEGEQPFYVVLGDPPFVREVKVKQNGVVQQHYRWEDRTDASGNAVKREKRSIKQKSLDRGNGDMTCEITFSTPVLMAACFFNRTRFDRFSTANEGVSWSVTIPARELGEGVNKLMIRAELFLRASDLSLTLDKEPETVAVPDVKEWTGYERQAAEMVDPLTVGNPRDFRIVADERPSGSDVVFADAGAIGSPEEGLMKFKVALAAEAADFLERTPVHFVVDCDGQKRHFWVFWRDPGRAFGPMESDGQSEWASFFVPYSSGGRTLSVTATAGDFTAKGQFQVMPRPGYEKLVRNWIAEADERINEITISFESQLAELRRNPKANGLRIAQIERVEWPDQHSNWQIRKAVLQGRWKDALTLAGERKAIPQARLETFMTSKEALPEELKAWEMRMRQLQQAADRATDNIDAVIAILKEEQGKGPPLARLNTRLLEQLVRAGQRDEAFELWVKEIDNELALDFANISERDKALIRKGRIRNHPAWVPQEMLKKLDP